MVSHFNHEDTTFLFFLLVSSFFSFSFQIEPENNTTLFSLSFPLKIQRLSSSVSKSMYSSSLFAQVKQNPGLKPTSYAYKSNFKYSMALIVSLPIGTPPQPQQMVLDTGSQLSWIQCHRGNKPPKNTNSMASFNPSISSSFSVLPCTHPMCKPRIPDFTLPTSCDQNRLCHYSYFYADGTYAEGNLVNEKFTFSVSQATPPLVLGCAQTSGTAEEDRGILGMNLGRLSFTSQAKITKFSYCTPIRTRRVEPTGSFYLGENPSSKGFKYVKILTFPRSQRMPNLDPLAFTLPLVGIRIGTKKLDISPSVLRPDAGGSGQTMIDSGSEYTLLVDEAYNKVKEEIMRLVGPKLKKGYMYSQTLDMCFDGNPFEIGRLIGDMAWVFDNGVELVVYKETVLDDVGNGVHCVGIGRSSLLGVASNIIGNVHQQNQWVEYDVTNRRVGFGKADCSRSL